MNDEIPDVPVASARRSIWDRVSVVWLVPLAALVIALGIAWQAYVDRGTVIEIVFDDAAGISAGQTELRFRNVAVGRVEKVRFTDNLARVIVDVRLQPEVAEFVDEGAQFWVVRPEVTSQGVTGLETVLTGVFIEGQWDSDPGGTVYYHEGESTAPLMPANQSGLRIVLRSTDGALTTAMPLLYQGVPVGRIGNARVGEDGLSVEAEAVVFAPYDRLVRKGTRFWDASGFSFSLGAGGATVNFASLASLIIGGGTFETFVSGSPPAEDGDVFQIYLYEADARASIFSRAIGPTAMLTAIFEGNITGLATGSPVELNGLRIGEVSAINGVIDEGRFGDDGVRLQTVMTIQPSSLGIEGDQSPDLALDYLERQVQDGLRARLVTGSLLTGGLKVQLLMVDGAVPDTLDRDALPYPLIPTTESDITDVATTAEGTLTRINDLPIEDLMASAIGFLDNASMLVGSPEVQGVPTEIRGLIADVRAVVGSEQVQAVPAQMTSLLTELEATVIDVRTLLAEIQERDAAERILAGVDAVGLAATNAGTALEGVPELIDEITLVASRIGDLPLNEVVQQIDRLATSMDALLSNAETQAVPRDIVTTLRTARRVMASLQQEGGLISNTNAALVSARGAADQIAAAAATADQSLEGVPALIDEITALTAKAQSLPLSELVQQATDLMATVDVLVGSDEIQALPADLSAALNDLGAVLDAIRSGGIIENANATLVSAREAANQIAIAAQNLPTTIQRANTVLDAAAAAINGLSTSGVIRDASDAMREITRAAEAVAQLARTIERNPNALIFGR